MAAPQVWEAFLLAVAMLWLSKEQVLDRGNEQVQEQVLDQEKEQVLLAEWVQEQEQVLELEQEQVMGFHHHHHRRHHHRHQWVRVRGLERVLVLVPVKCWRR